MNDPNKVKQVPLTQHEIETLIKLLKRAIPDQNEQETVWNVVNRLEIIKRL